jgi:hypothetical protein
MTLYDEDILDILDQAQQIRNYGFKDGIKFFHSLNSEFPASSAYNVDPSYLRYYIDAHVYGLI